MKVQLEQNQQYLVRAVLQRVMMCVTIISANYCVYLMHVCLEIMFILCHLQDDEGLLNWWDTVEGSV